MECIGLKSISRDRKQILTAFVQFVVVALVLAISAEAQANDSMVQCWSFREPVSVTGGLLLDDVNVYAVTAEDRLLALERKSGEVVWTTEPGGSVALPIRSFNSSLIVISRTASSDGKPRASYIRSISKTTGITNWVTPLQPADAYNIAGDDKALYIFAADGTVTSVDPMSGAIRWVRDGSGFGNKGLHFGSNWIARRSRERTVEIVSLEDQKLLGRFEIGIQPKVIASRGNESFVIGDALGNLEAYSLGSRSKSWSYKAGGAISHLILRDDNVVAGSADNFVYSMSLSSGNVEWKRRMPGRVNSIGTLAETRLVLTVVGEKSAYVLDLADGKFSGQFALEGDEEFVGYPLAGDDRFVVALTNRGIIAFSAGCQTQKAAE